MYTVNKHKIALNGADDITSRCCNNASQRIFGLKIHDRTGTASLRGTGGGHFSPTPVHFFAEEQNIATIDVISIRHCAHIQIFEITNK